MAKKDKSKKVVSKPFYQKWWFWLTIGLILCGNIAVLIWVNCAELKSNLLTLMSGWVSFIATLVIGLIAFNQSKNYKEENDNFIQEQKDLGWKENYSKNIERFLKRFDSYAELIKNYNPNKIGNIFTKCNDTRQYYEYDFLNNDYDNMSTHFLLFLRESNIFNDAHKELYKNYVLFYDSLTYLFVCYEQIRLGHNEFYNKVQNSLKKANYYYNQYVDYIFIYDYALESLLFSIYDVDIYYLKTAYYQQMEEKKKWEKSVKNLTEYIKQLRKEEEAKWIN